MIGVKASDLWEKSPADNNLRVEARLFEVLLPVVACLFVFGSVAKQMKNFCITGLLFLGIGIVRLQQELFRDRAAWPVALLVSVCLLMLAAANYDSIKSAARRAAKKIARR